MSTRDVGGWGERRGRKRDRGKAREREHTRAHECVNSENLKLRTVHIF